MLRWTEIILALCLGVTLTGCKIVGPEDRAQGDAVGPPTGTMGIAKSASEGEEAPDAEADVPADGETDAEAEADETEFTEDAEAAEGDAEDAEGTAEAEATEVEGEAAEAEGGDAEPAVEEEEPAVEAQAEVEDEGDTEPVAEAVSRPVREATSGTPGVKVLALAANAELLDAHLQKCEKALSLNKFETAKRALANAHRALSYLDAQRTSSILSQSLDHIDARIQEEDAVGARRALRIAEDQMDEADTEGSMEDQIEELADLLKDKDFDSAAAAIQELQDSLAESATNEERVIQAIRAGLVHTQSAAVERHAPKIAIAELKEVRAHVRKLMRDAEPQEGEEQE